MNIGQRVREAREALGMQRTVLARRVGVAENTIYRIETGKRTPSIELLEGIARELRTEPAELLRELSPSAEAPPRGWSDRVSASVVDVQRALLEAEHLRETARPRVEEALARIADAHASAAHSQASRREQVADSHAIVADAHAIVADTQASYREQVADSHLQAVRRVMDQVYGSELELGWAYVKEMMEEGSSEGQQARRLRSASRKMVLFYEELVGLIKDAGVQVKRKDEGEAVGEPETSARLEALEITVH
jgi:transcriptional regulator with XRE-family HTH domain